MSDRRTRRPRPIELGGVEVAGRQVQARGRAHSPRDRLTGQGGLEVPQRATLAHLLRRAASDLMDAHVIRMPIAAGGVVADKRTCVLCLDEIHEARHLVVDVARRKTPGCVTGEAGVGVAPGLQSGGAQDLRGTLELGRSHPGKVIAIFGGGEASGPIGGHGENHPMALGCRARHGPGGEEGLIIGVCVQEDQGRHGDILPPRLGVTARGRGVA